MKDVERLIKFIEKSNDRRITCEHIVGGEVTKHNVDYLVSTVKTIRQRGFGSWVSGFETPLDCKRYLNEVNTERVYDDITDLLGVMIDDSGYGIDVGVFIEVLDFSLTHGSNYALPIHAKIAHKHAEGIVKDVLTFVEELGD